MTVRVVTDSNAMLPAALTERFAITVVHLTVVIDGVPHLEADLDPVAFCATLRSGAAVSTSAPSPGQLLAAYERLAADGADEILSIHIGSNRSATVDAARLAAAQAPVPVTVVDTGTASFIQGCCVWRAAERLDEGHDVPAAADAARGVAAAAASVFTIGEIQRATAGGRLRMETAEGVPVFVSAGAEMRQQGSVTTMEQAVALMAEVVAAEPGPLRVGVGDADAEEGAMALATALQAQPNVADLVRYTVGPSVATHTGAGTVGAVYHRLD